MLLASHRFTALGTQWQIDTDAPLAGDVIRRVHDRVELFDRTYSRFRADSLIHTIAATPGTYSFPDDALDLFHFYRALYDLTHGAVTPLIGNALERAGYDATYTLRPIAQQPVPLWDDVLYVDGTTIATSQPITIDVGAAGKGYLIDIIGELLETAGITGYVIDGSGDMRHRGTSLNVVGLEDPLQPDRVIGKIDVENASLCASSTTKRAWGNKMHHILNPHTLMPVDDIMATWVIAERTMLADGLATALFFTSPAILAEIYDFEYVRYRHDGSVDYSANFHGEIF